MQHRDHTTPHCYLIKAPFLIDFNFFFDISKFFRNERETNKKEWVQWTGLKHFKYYFLTKIINFWIIFFLTLKKKRKKDT